MMRRTTASLAAMVCLVLAAGEALAGWTYGSWQVYTGVQGVGAVTKTSPAEDDLHYGGTGNPERADFAVATSGASDWDRRAAYCNGVFQYWEYQDAGLDETRTDWSCTAGTIADGAFATRYTPGNTPQSGITISVKVYNGTNYNPGDPSVTKSYPNTLKVYKVGEHLTTSPDGGNYRRWEDGTTEGTKPTEKVHTNLNVSGNNSDQKESTCDATWSLITQPSGCNIHGVIRGHADSSASGSHSLYAADTDWLDGGSGSCSVTVNVLIFSFSYNWDLDDSCMAIISTAIGYGSDYGRTYQETGLTLVSTAFTVEDCYESQSIAANPGSGQWTGKAGSEKKGKWKVQTKAQTKEAGGSTANAQNGSSADCTFDIPSNPSYE